MRTSASQMQRRRAQAWHPSPGSHPLKGPLFRPPTARERNLTMTKPVLPDAEELLASLTAQMRAHVTPQTGLVGIVTGGAWLAERLHRELKLEVPHGSLDVSFYRDDFQHKGLKHQVMPSAIPFEVEGRDLILVDDVLYTGRTIRAAMNELFDYGRPA